MNIDRCHRAQEICLDGLFTGFITAATGVLLEEPTYARFTERLKPMTETAVVESMMRTQGTSGQDMYV